MRPLLILLVLAALAGAAELPPGVVRVVGDPLLAAALPAPCPATVTSSKCTPQALLSDTHLAGPEYPLFGENGALDNASVTRTQQRLWRAVRAVNAMDPKPQVRDPSASCLFLTRKCALSPPAPPGCSPIVTGGLAPRGRGPQRHAAAGAPGPG